jgi:hypothetical protein
LVYVNVVNHGSIPLCALSSYIRRIEDDHVIDTQHHGVVCTKDSLSLYKGSEKWDLIKVRNSIAHFQSVFKAASEPNKKIMIDEARKIFKK